MRRTWYMIPVLAVFAAGMLIGGQPEIELIRKAQADQTFDYTGGPFDIGRLSDELITAGIVPISMHGEGSPTTVVSIMVADGVSQASVTAVVNAHVSTATKASDLILVRRNAANDGFEIGRLGGIWSPWDPDFVKSTRKGSDETNSTNTLANCAGLNFTLKSDTVYDFNFTIYFTAAAATTGLVLSMDGPASPVAVRFGAEIAESSTSFRNGSAASYNAELVGQNSGGAAALVAHIHGTVQTNSSGGTLKVRFRSEVNGSAVTILKGSHGELKS